MARGGSEGNEPLSFSQLTSAAAHQQTCLAALCLRSVRS
jgi:hypothetical protein